MFSPYSNNLQSVVLKCSTAARKWMELLVCVDSEVLELHINPLNAELNHLPSASIIRSLPYSPR